MSDVVKFRNENKPVVSKKKRFSPLAPLESELYLWILEQHSKFLVVIHDDIMEKAIQIAADMKIENFKAPSWLENFKKRFRLTYRKITHDSWKAEFTTEDLVSTSIDCWTCICYFCYYMDWFYFRLIMLRFLKKYMKT